MINPELLASFRSRFYFPFDGDSYWFDLPLSRQIDKKLLVVIGEGWKKGWIYRFDRFRRRDKKPIFVPTGEFIDMEKITQSSEVEAQGYFLARRFKIKM